MDDKADSKLCCKHSAISCIYIGGKVKYIVTLEDTEIGVKRKGYIHLTNMEANLIQYYIGESRN